MKYCANKRQLAISCIFESKFKNDICRLLVELGQSRLVRNQEHFPDVQVLRLIVMTKLLHNIIALYLVDASTEIQLDSIIVKAAPFCVITTGHH